MSRNYKFHKPEELYFVSFAVVDWLDVFTYQPEGYVEPTVTSSGVEMNYIYQYKDHLGNIRLSYKNTGTVSSPILEIVEENNYYPFGLEHKGYNNVVNGTDHKYGFGGKEEQNELNLGWIDITARNYDPALGRWMNLDPLTEQMTRHSPYNYAFDNPIYFIDPDGMAPRSSIIIRGKRDLETSREQGFAGGEYSDPDDPIKFFNYLFSLLGWNDYSIGDDIMSEINGEENEANNTLAPLREVNLGVQEWIVENKDDLLLFAEASQEVGDVVAIVGYTLTLTGYGAPVGIPLAAVGNGFSLGGDLIEVSVFISENELSKVRTKGGFIAAGMLIDLAIKKAPGSDELIKQVLSQTGGLTINITKKMVENTKE